MEVFDGKFMGLSVEMDGETCGKLKNSVEQWRPTKPYIYGYYTLPM